MKVKKAVIISAGLASRMLPYTKVESKLMIPILNKPVIQYLVEEIIASGIKEIIIVSTHTSKLKGFFSENKELDLILSQLKKNDIVNVLSKIEKMADITFLDQEKPYGWMHEVLHAKKYLKDSPFVVCFSDVLYDSKVPATKQLLNEFSKNQMNIKANARFIFKPSLFALLAQEKFILGQDTIDIDIFDKLDEEGDILNFNIVGDFFDVGDPLSYMKTQTIFALKDQKIGPQYKKFLNGLK